MASYTQHYQLHQWEPSDDFLRSDFNDDFKKIDAAIHDSEEGLRTDFDGEVSRLDAALSAAQQTLQQNLNTQVTRLDKALDTAQQTLRKEFNGNLDKTNAALESVRALAAGKSTVVFGSYVGDGQTHRVIDVGFTIKWAFVYVAGGRPSTYKAGLAAPGTPPAVSSDKAPLLSVVGTAIHVGYGGLSGPFTNETGEGFYYIVAK